MKSGATKTGNKVIVSVALPDNIVQIIDEMAQNENRCRSNFVETFLLKMLTKEDINENKKENNEQ